MLPFRGLCCSYTSSGAGKILKMLITGTYLSNRCNLWLHMYLHPPFLLCSMAGWVIIIVLQAVRRALCAEFEALALVYLKWRLMDLSVNCPVPRDVSQTICPFGRFCVLTSGQMWCLMGNTISESSIHRGDCDWISYHDGDCSDSLHVKISSHSELLRSSWDGQADAHCTVQYGQLWAPWRLCRRWS